VLRIIREILFFKPQHRGTDITGALQFFNRVTRRRAVAFLISDFFDRGYERDLTIAHQKHDMIAVKVEDRREYEWADVGLVELEDYETGNRRLIDTGSRAAKKQFEHTVSVIDNHRQRFFDSIKLDTVNVATDRPIADGLIKFFRQRERRVRH
jgi:hypothetical protein